MSRSDIVVVGGSAAGLTAAITARRHYPDKSVMMVRKELQVPVPCGIPYIFGTLDDPTKNIVPDAVLGANSIDLRICEAQSIDRERHELQTTDGVIGYDRLILATGSLPVNPPIPGIDRAGVFKVEKDMVHLAAIQHDLQDARNVVVIGGGFIGIEIGDEINKRPDVNVTIVEVAPHCLSMSYDPEFCVEMEDHLRSRGVHVRTSAMVEAITGDGHASGVQLKDGTMIPADVVIMGIGARANVTLARDAGLALGPTGSVAVDRNMRTSDDHIFACGDCVEKVSFFTGRPSPLKLASIAQLEARIAGANVYGLRRESEGTLGVWSTAVGELAMGTAGLTESLARHEGYDVVCASVETPNRHPGCMPGGAVMKVKLVFERHTQVLIGGQVRGNAAIGELVNTIAACVQKRMTAEDIVMFQLGTHPALTASPIVYPLVNAAELASCQMSPH